MGKPFYGQKNDRDKKLSWVYRRKAKLRRAQNLETKESDTNDSADANGQNSRIIVRNLPFKATEKDVRRFYEPFGEIREINLLKRPDGNPVGCGFVGFKHVEDASKAIFNTNKKEFLGRIISSDWAISKSRFCEKLEKKLAENQKIDKDGRQNSQNDHENDDERNNVLGIKKAENNLEKQKRRKFLKMKKRKKRARIVIRNLSFQITEDNLRKHFSKYGEIEEIKILSRHDGCQSGVAFLQFNVVQSAAKAIHYANMQSLLDRPMVVDWAVPKGKFSQTRDVKPEIKTESIDKEEAHDVSEIKISNSDEDASCDSNAEPNSNEVTIESIKSEDESDDEVVEVKHETEDINNDDDEDDESDGNDENDDDDEDVNVVNKKEKEQDGSDTKCLRRVSNDISEGKTIFLKNLPFSVKNEELQNYMEQFGPVYYALVCIDPLTEYSKGTAFVKFRRVEDAEKCLSAGTELRLRDQIIEAHRALHRKEVENVKERRVKDSRNLYLVKEGVVLARSKAAEEVSVFDMEKRLKLEQWKSQMLRNLNMFVSRVRLVVHNLPPNLDNAKLRQLFKNHSGPKAVIKEARVMCDLKNVDVTGKGKSKEYAFVTFTTHEDALKALRSINNNPNIFSKSRRPIVGFSIENRILVNAKERRLEKSRERNSLWSGNKNKRANENAKEEVPAKRVKARKLDNSDEKSYTGLISREGHGNLRPNYKLKSQVESHTQSVKKQKKLDRAIKQRKFVKKEKAKNKRENMQVKQTKKVDADDSFNKLLNNYRNKLKGIDLKKSKWYEASK